MSQDDDSIDGKCGAVELYTLSLARRQAFLEAYNRLHPEKPVTSVSQIHRMVETCTVCQYNINAAGEDYCLKTHEERETNM